jgi:hypothetical protein
VIENINILALSPTQKMQHEVDLLNKATQEKDTHCIVEKCLVG